MVNLTETFDSRYIEFVIENAIPKSIKLGANVVGDLLGPGLIEVANLM